MVTILDVVLGAAIALCVVLVITGYYNKRIRNQSFALGMLYNVMTADLKEVLKTCSRGNNLHSPMKHLCQTMVYYLALYGDDAEALIKMNAHFASVRLGLPNFGRGVEIPEILVEKHPRNRHALRINVTGVGRWKQDLHDFTNFDIISRDSVHTS